jgi:hypothetical protein
MNLELQMVAPVIPAAVEQERFETWVMAEVEAGSVLPGLYPPSAEAKKRYEAACTRDQAG